MATHAIVKQRIAWFIKVDLETVYKGSVIDDPD